MTTNETQEPQGTQMESAAGPTLEDEVQLRELVPAGVSWNSEPGGIAEVDARVDALMHAIGRLNGEMKTNAAVAAARAEQVRTWATDVNAKLQASVDFLTRKIQDLTRTYDFGKKKSRSLPAGTFGFRKTGEGIELINPAAALAWAKANNAPSCYVVSERVSPTGLLEHVKATGELPDGVQFKPVRDVFFVKARDREEVA